MSSGSGNVGLQFMAVVRNNSCQLRVWVEKVPHPPPFSLRGQPGKACDETERVEVCDLIRISMSIGGVPVGHMFRQPCWLFHVKEEGFEEVPVTCGILAEKHWVINLNPTQSIAIYELLFKEGMMVTKKDIHMPKHSELADKNVSNLHVMKAMQSLKSRSYVKEQFAWRHFYWYLTNEGIQYLQDYLHLPLEIVPATLHSSHPETGRPRPKGPGGEQPARFTRGEADRDTYRRSAVPPGADKKAEGAGSATEFQFRGGFGRGLGQPPQ
ncbi:40S ribosomal protein S10-like [Mastomys coucha]|uniref:40S ribosomal protein S10-like n=1 Tax=Mastomys coucha TaxID=35658 RepID=UPI001262A357|nr:40S ribosomal protein S10-like [Mastomys coucha]